MMAKSCINMNCVHIASYMWIASFPLLYTGINLGTKDPSVFTCNSFSCSVTNQLLAI